MACISCWDSTRSWLRNCLATTRPGKTKGRGLGCQARGRVTWSIVLQCWWFVNPTPPDTLHMGVLVQTENKHCVKPCWLRCMTTRIYYTLASRGNQCPLGPVTVGMCLAREVLCQNPDQAQGQESPIPSPPLTPRLWTFSWTVVGPS